MNLEPSFVRNNTPLHVWRKPGDKNTFYQAYLTLSGAVRLIVFERHQIPGADRKVWTGIIPLGGDPSERAARILHTAIRQQRRTYALGAPNAINIFGCGVFICGKPIGFIHPTRNYLVDLYGSRQEFWGQYCPKDWREIALRLLHTTRGDLQIVTENYTFT